MGSKPVRQMTANQKILEFEPPTLRRGTDQVVLEFLDSARKSKTHFRAAETTRVQTGPRELESQSIEQEIEQKILEKLKPVQESAYQEAHQLGMIEGRRESFATASTEISECLKSLGEMLVSIQSLKKELYQQNESHLIKLLLAVAAKVAFHEVTVNVEALQNLIKAAIEESQADEKVTVRLAPQHLAFFEELQKKESFDLEFLKKAKFVADESITPGGCVLETNYGEIDARIEERIRKLHESFQDMLFPTKTELKSA